MLSALENWRRLGVRATSPETLDRRRARRRPPRATRLIRQRFRHPVGRRGRTEARARRARDTAASFARRSRRHAARLRALSGRASRRGHGACTRPASECASATTSESRNGKRPSTECAISMRSPCDDRRYPESRVRISRYWSCASGLQPANSVGSEASSSEATSRPVESRVARRARTGA